MRNCASCWGRRWPPRRSVCKEVEAPAESLADLERHYGPEYVKTIYA